MTSYWLIPVALFSLQANFIFNSNNQIRFEELIESVQAPYWFYHQQLIAGTHTNVGWYAALALIYEIFGFSLNTPKYFLLSLYGISVVCQALILRKFFSPGVASIILLTLGLSPTLLTFNSQNLHLGVGLMVIPVLILLLMALDFKKLTLAKVITAVVFLVSSIVLLFYPPFFVYLPAVGLFWLKKLREIGGMREIWVMWGLGVVAFLLPIIFSFGYFQNRELLIFDASTGTGMFRGGGQISFSEETFSLAWSGLINDFFIKSVSYHFEAEAVEFSWGFPLITIITTIIFITIIYRREKGSRFFINLILLTIAFNAVIISITSDYGIPGMKRSTPILASLYGLWVIAWWGLEGRKVRGVGGTWGSRVILGLLLVHHLIAYPINLISLKDLSPFADSQWFATMETPQQSLDEMVKRLQQEDVILDCRPYLLRYTSCDYQFIYSALKLSCLWNHLPCREVILGER